MNIAVIFAGGMGTRMNRKDNIPKQFLTVCDKPIIVHTIEIFQNTKEIDAIVVSCIEDWIPHMEDLKNSYNLDKIKKDTDIIGEHIEKRNNDIIPSGGRVFALRRTGKNFDKVKKELIEDFYCIKMNGLYFREDIETIKLI